MRLGSCGQSLLLTLALTLVGACGSRSSLLQPGGSLNEGGSDGSVVGSGGNAVGGGGAGGSGGLGSGGSGGSCYESGVRACDREDAAEQLVCVDGSWQSAGRCLDESRCDPATGACAALIEECSGLSVGDRYCTSADRLMECGPNLLSSSLIEPCVGRCVAMGSTAACAAATCGDGKVQADEACDDGNTNSADDCTELCQLPACGDGFGALDEDCDDGNVSDGDQCPANCRLDVLQVSAAGAFGCAVHEGGLVKCWGDNGYGQLGLGDQEWRGDEADEMGSNLPVTQLGSGRTPKLLVAGWYHVCALLDDDSVKCWGNNAYGELGLGDTERRGDDVSELGDALPTVDLGTGRSAKAFALGVGYGCALLDDASVKCWGASDYGQVGLGDTERRGDEPNEMGDALPTVDLGTGRSAKALASGTYHTCALLDDDSIKCWGTNDEGQLGLGDTEWRGDAANEMGDALPSVNLGTGRTAKAVAVGHAFSCALLDDDSIKCWGTNEIGQLGQGDKASRGDEAGELGDALPAIQLGTGRSAQALVASAYHVCALLDDDAVKCWGYNEYGQLGIGDPFARGDHPDEMGDALPAVALGSGLFAKALAGGGHHTCALLEVGLVKCWGANDFGQLGLEDTAWRGASPDELGDELPTVDFW